MSADTNTTSCSVIVPAYNEEGAIAQVIRSTRRVLEEGGIVHEIVVVDDGSTDRTREEAEAAGATVWRHETNRGYGAAIKTGVRHALHETIVITDADGTYPIERIPDLVAGMANYDMVVGARTGRDAQIPWARRPVKWFLGKFANYVAGRRIPDLNSGLRAFRRRDALGFLPLLPDGFSLTTHITLAALSEGMNLSYLPIDYHARTGKSKIRPVRDTLRFFAMVGRLALYFNPMRVFLPIALLCTLVSVSKLVYDAFVYSFSLRGTTVAALVLTAQVWMLGIVADLVVAQRKRR